MKNSWLVWLFVVGVIITVFVAFNYQDKQKPVALNEIFPEDYTYPVDVEYEFVDETPVAVGSDEEIAAVTETVVAVVDKSAVVSPKVAASNSVPVKTSVPVEVSKPKPTPKKESSSSTVDAAYTIQVASFKKKSMADDLAEDLKTKNFIARVGKRDLGEKGIWYRVYVGSYESKKQAETNLLAVKKFYDNSFVIKQPK